MDVRSFTLIPLEALNTALSAFGCNERSEALVAALGVDRPDDWPAAEEEEEEEVEEEVDEEEEEEEEEEEKEGSGGDADGDENNGNGDGNRGDGGGNDGDGNEGMRGPMTTLVAVMTLQLRAQRLWMSLLLSTLRKIVLRLPGLPSVENT